MPRIASSTYLAQLLTVSATCGVLATFAWATHGTQVVPAAEIPVPELATTEVVQVAMSEIATVHQPPPPSAPSNQLLYVFTVGKDVYVRLSDDEPKHGKRKLVEDEHGANTVAEVAIKDLPAKYRDWADKSFTVDGGCTATTQGFAVVTRLVGDPDYAGIEASKWTVSTAARAGTPQLAARIAVPKQCERALYARDASLAPMAALEKLDRPELVDQARSALLASAVADDAQTEWTADNQNADSWIEHAEITSFTRRHPRTGAIYVGIHATILHGCGGPDVNVWGLFRVGRDGQLVTIEARKLETLYSIEQILDVDNDGKLELLGHDWLGLSNVLTRADGEEISRLTMQFYGCPC